jgi:hypothetical protein
MTAKIRFIALVVIFCMQLPPVKAQVILFHEDFETSPVTSLVNTWNSETQLPDGPSPCGSATRGNAGIFNSMSVDFQSAQNPSYFMGVNPQSPCGGFYVATVGSGTLDFSSADSLVLVCRYFLSNSLFWGSPTLQVNIKNGPSNYVVWDLFTTLGSWDSLTVGIPSTQIGATDTIYVLLGGGEAVGIDDITILNIEASSVTRQHITEAVQLSPNPVSNFFTIKGNLSGSMVSVVDVYGKILLQEKCSNENEISINTEQIPAGIYIIKIIDSFNRQSCHKIMKY